MNRSSPSYELAKECVQNVIDTLIATCEKHKFQPTGTDVTGLLLCALITLIRVGKISAQQQASILLEYIDGIKDIEAPAQSTTPPSD